MLMYLMHFQRPHSGLFCALRLRAEFFVVPLSYSAKSSERG